MAAGLLRLSPGSILGPRFIPDSAGLPEVLSVSVGGCSGPFSAGPVFGSVGRWPHGLPPDFLRPEFILPVLCLLVWGGDFASAENLERVAACLMGRSQAVPETQAVQKPLSTQGFTDCDLTILSSASQGASREQLMRDFLVCVERSSRI